MSDTDRLLDEKFDGLFKEIISAGWNVKSDGNVESPTGFFAIVEIPEHHGELVDMREAVFGSPSNPEETPSHWQHLHQWPDSGWYFTVENSDGIICVYSVTKREAEQAFDSSSLQYKSWAFIEED